MSPAPRTRAQRLAEAALTRIRAVAADWPADGQSRPSAGSSAGFSRAQYKARADQFPVLVMQAGLAQALGFLRAKAGDADGGDNAYRRYLNDLAVVVGASDGEALQQQAIAAPLPAYRQLTRQVLDAAGWLKRFGQAYLGASADAAGNGAPTAQEAPWTP